MKILLVYIVFNFVMLGVFICLYKGANRSIFFLVNHRVLYYIKINIVLVH